MSDDLRMLWRSTAIFSFFVGLLAISVLFTLSLVFEISPSFWDIEKFALSTRLTPTPSQRTLLFAGLAMLYVLPLLAVRIAMRLIFLCACPKEWTFLRELFLGLWVFALATRLITDATIFVGLSFPHETEGFRYMLQANLYYYAFSELASGLLFVMIGVAGWLGARIPRSLAALTLAGGAVSVVVSPFLTNTTSTIYKAQPQNLILGVLIMLYTIYLYLGSRTYAGT